MAMDKVKVNNEEVLKDRLVAINRVTKVTKGGRTFTFAAIVVVGDGNGVIGYGLGKAGEVTAAIAKGTEAAKKNLVKVPVLKGTVPHEVETSFGGAKVLIKPAAAGTGLKAGGPELRQKPHDRANRPSAEPDQHHGDRRWHKNHPHRR